MNQEIHILQHTLGLDQYGRGNSYRNHFVTIGESKDLETIKDLVSLGLMEQTRTPSFCGSDTLVFSVTEKGREYVAKNSPPPPKISKSKARYKRFLEFGDCFDSFIEFCRWDAQIQKGK